MMRQASQRVSERQIRARKTVMRQSAKLPAGQTGTGGLQTAAKQRPTGQASAPIRLPLDERHTLVKNVGILLGNRQLQKQLSAATVQTQAVKAAAAPAKALTTITEVDKAEFELLKKKIEDPDVEAYVQHREKVFGATAEYLKYAALADAELDNTKGLRRIVELSQAPAAQTILYRWLRKAYETKAGVTDVPGLIKQGMSKELKAAIEQVQAAYSKTFRHGGFNPRPKKNAKYRFCLGTVSEHGLGKAVDIEAKKNPILSLKDWQFIEQLAGKQVDRKATRWQKEPEKLWSDIAELNRLFVAKIIDEVVRIERERAAAGSPPKGKKLPEPIEEVFAKHKPLKKWKDGFFTLEWALVKALHEQGLRWGATFSNAVDLHHFEL